MTKACTKGMILHQSKLTRMNSHTVAVIKKLNRVMYAVTIHSKCTGKQTTDVRKNAEKKTNFLLCKSYIPFWGNYSVTDSVF